MAVINSCGIVEPDYSGCCEPPLPGQQPPPVTGPPGPPGPPGVSCPLFCGIDSPEGVVTSPIGGPYEQTNAASTSHPLWLKMTGVGDTGWKPWAGLGAAGAAAYRIGDGSAAAGAAALAFGTLSTASGLRALAIGESTVASGARAEAIGYNSQATADDAKAFGAGAVASAAAALAFGLDTNVDSADGIGIGQLADVNALRGIGIGKGARIDAVEGISFGDGRTLSINDISIGWSHDFGAAVARGSILIGKNATINNGVDSSSSTTSLYGAHILIGEDTEAPYAASQFQSLVIGFKAKARGRAVVAIGQEAESRAADTPVVGMSEGRFATIIGYRAKASGGCVVSVGDQCDARGDSSVAVGTNSRANYHSTAAVGPNCFAGGLTSTTGSGAAAFGVSASARANGALALGYTAIANAAVSIALGQLAFVNTAHEGGIAIGNGANTKSPYSIMIGDDGSGGGARQWSIHFNDNPSPAILITENGKLQFVAGMFEADTSRTFPIAANITLDAVDTNLFMSTTAAARTVTLPPSAGVAIGKRYFIRRETATANNVTIVPDGVETIDGAANFVLTAQWKWVLLQNDGIAGFEWAVVDSN